MSNSQSLKRINLQNLRVCPSTLRQLLLYTVETTVESTIRLSRRWQCRSGHQQRFLGQTQERMPRLQELVQRQVLCFSHVFLWALLAMPKTEKNGNTKMRCHHETRVIHGKKICLWHGFDQIDQQKQHRENLAADLSVEMILHGLMTLMSREIKPAESHPRAFAILSIISGCFHWFHM